MRTNSQSFTQESVENAEQERLLNEYEYSAWTNRSVASARLDRRLGKGCPFVRLSHSIRYRPSDVRQYIEQNVRKIDGGKA
jgi:hypothetical protein